MSERRSSVDFFFFLDLLDETSAYGDRLPLLYALERSRAHRNRARRDAAAGEARPAPLPAVAEPDPDDPWALAQRWSRERRSDRAVESALRAAQESLRKHRPLEAARRFAFALRHLEHDDRRRAALNRKSAAALEAAGLFGVAARRYSEALRTCRGRVERAECLALRAGALVEAGRFHRARESAEQSLALRSNRIVRARAARALGIALGRLGLFDRAQKSLEAAVTARERENDHPAMLAEAYQSLGLLELRRRRSTAREHLRHALELFGDSGSSGRGLKARAGLVVLDARDGESGRAERGLAEMRATALAAGRHQLLEATLSRLGSLAFEQGRLDVALELGREALEVARSVGDPDLVLAGHCRLAETLRECGRAGDAAELLQQALRKRLAGSADALGDLARVLLAGALIERSPGPDDTTRLLLDRALPQMRARRENWIFLLGLTVELERLAHPGCPDADEPVIREFETRSARTDAEPATLIRAALARAEARLHRGKPEEARDAANAAATMAATQKSPLAEAAAQILLWRALTLLDDRPDASRSADRARQLLQQVADRIGDPDVRRDTLARRTFRSLRGPAQVSPGADRRLLALYEMIRALNSETDTDALLESLLDMALQVVKAQRGMILLADPGGDGLTVRLARNIESETAQDAESFSRRVVEQAGSGDSLLVLDASRDERFRNLRSVSLYGIRSLMCVPLRVRGKILGTVYLDSRLDAALFTRSDLGFLEAFADHAALALENLRQRAELEREHRRLEAAARARVRFSGLVGAAPSMQKVFDLIERVSPSDFPVLIRGESGTGKELVARAIHFNSGRRRKVLLSENCASMPEALLESELFGHVKGAFTGADRDRPGLFEQADGGTLFLDEIGDTSAPMQAKLLRVLETGVVRRVGGGRPTKVDVRILAATHRDLDSRVAEGRFREDLYYRLQVVGIEVPPLRRRPGDVRLLAEHFLQVIGEECGRPPVRLEPPVIDALEAYSWPGNVRQLENALKRLCLLAEEGPVTLDALRSDPGLRKMLAREERAEPPLSLARSERERVVQALSAAEGNRDRAARLLGVSRATIYRKIKRHGLG